MGKVTLWDHCFELPDRGAEEVSARLTRSGVGEAGVRQLLAGDIVSDLRDRQRLAGVVQRGLGLTGSQRRVEVGMLIPAVQGVSAPRAPAHASGALEALGLGSTAAGSLLAGRAIHDADERRRLARIAAAATGAAGATSARGITVMLMDGSVR